MLREIYILNKIKLIIEYIYNDNLNCANNCVYFINSRIKMATSLAEQLKKLRAPQTAILLQDKKRSSLLFDPKEAANLDKETVLSIGDIFYLIKRYRSCIYG